MFKVRWWGGDASCFRSCAQAALTRSTLPIATSSSIVIAFRGAERDVSEDESIGEGASESVVITDRQIIGKPHGIFDSLLKVFENFLVRMTF